jgi:hypothetical protein
VIPVQILRGCPDDAELAALVIVLVAAAGAQEEEPAPRPDWVMPEAGQHPAGSWIARPGSAWR